MNAANGKPAHAPFAQGTAERCCAAEETHRLPPPPDARPWGDAYAELLESARQGRLIDALIEQAIGPAADVLLERIEARFDRLTRRLARLERRMFGDVEGGRDTRRPAPRPADTQPRPGFDPAPPLHPALPHEPEPEPEGDPGPAQTPPDADDPAGEEHPFEL